MAVTEKVTCDVCGVERQESNHWLVASSSIYDGVAVRSEFSVRPWDGEYRHLQHLCGEGCAGKLLAQKIAEWRQS